VVNCCSVSPGSHSLDRAALASFRCLGAFELNDPFADLQVLERVEDIIAIEQSRLYVLGLDTICHRRSISIATRAP
jgi:hypothetical protein